MSDVAPAIRAALRPALAALESLRLRGDAVECPCCGGRFRRFAPGGVERRPGARCPRCGSLERHRLAWLWLARESDLTRAPKRVLHVAPEAVLAARLRALPNVHYLSVDLDSPLAMRRVDIRATGLPDASYDVVLCSHVFEHVVEDGTAMRELLRLLAPGGWAILQTPFDPALAVSDEDPAVTDPAQRRLRFGQSDHVRIYGRDLFDRLAQSGWSIERIAYARRLGPAATRRHGLDPDEEILLGRRRAEAR